MCHTERMRVSSRNCMQMRNDNELVRLCLQWNDIHESLIICKYITNWLMPVKLLQYGQYDVENNPINISIMDILNWLLFSILFLSLHKVQG